MEAQCKGSEYHMPRSQITIGLIDSQKLENSRSRSHYPRNPAFVQWLHSHSYSALLSIGIFSFIFAFISWSLVGRSSTVLHMQYIPQPHALSTWRRTYDLRTLLGVLLPTHTYNSTPPHAFIEFTSLLFRGINKDLLSWCSTLTIRTHPVHLPRNRLTICGNTPISALRCFPTTCTRTPPRSLPPQSLPIVQHDLLLPLSSTPTWDSYGPGARHISDRALFSLWDEVERNFRNPIPLPLSVSGL